MRNKKKWLPLLAAAVLLLGLAGWRLWPRGLDAVLRAEAREATGLACAVTVAGAEGGVPYTHSHTLSDLSAGEEDFAALLALLDASGYRPDFRNLLPGDRQGASAEGDAARRGATLLLTWGGAAEESCALIFQGDGSLLAAAGTDAGLKTYHPTDPALLDALIAYVQAHGEAG